MYVRNKQARGALLFGTSTFNVGFFLKRGQLKDMEGVGPFIFWLGRPKDQQRSSSSGSQKKCDLMPKPLKKKRFSKINKMKISVRPRGGCLTRLVTTKIAHPSLSFSLAKEWGCQQRPHPNRGPQLLLGAERPSQAPIVLPSFESKSAIFG